MRRAERRKYISQREGLPAIPGWKRRLDWFLLLSTSPLWVPAFLVCAVWIKLVSRGPLFYVQQRIGLNGKAFSMFKFRSMKVGEDTAVHENHLSELIGSDKPMTKLDASDSRLIPGGKLLRASGLDELPQLINIIRGEMSMVGPRPCTPLEFGKYNACEMKRFNGLPGITGYWQVSGKNRTNFRSMVALDIVYVRKASARMDLFVLLMTIPAIIQQLFDLLREPAAEAWAAKRKARRDGQREARRKAYDRAAGRQQPVNFHVPPPSLKARQHQPRLKPESQAIFGSAKSFLTEIQRPTESHLLPAASSRHPEASHDPVKP